MFLMNLYLYVLTAEWGTDHNSTNGPEVLLQPNLVKFYSIHDILTLVHLGFTLQHAFTLHIQCWWNCDYI